MGGNGSNRVIWNRFRRSSLPLVLLIPFLFSVVPTPAPATGSSDRSFTPRTLHIRVTQVRSGDEIQSGGLKIRLMGIVSPPFGTPIGSDAVLFLNTLILNRDVVCRLSGQAFRDQELGTCRIGGRDISELLVREGLALPCRRLGGRLYDTDVKRAKDTGIADSFTPPLYCGKPSSSEDEIPRI